MGRATSSSDSSGRGPAPATGPFSLSKDMFKEQADRLAARKGGKPVGDAFATKPGAKKNAFAAPAETPPPLSAEAFRPEPARRKWTLANGAALQVVASQREIVKAATLDRDEKRIERRAAKSSSFVLVSSSSVVEAPAAAGGGQGELVMPSLSSPKFQPKAKPKKSGGGGNGGGDAGDGGGAVAPRDRIFNQDDLAGVLIVLAVLLLMLLYLFRGNGGAAGGDEETLNVQSASSAPAAPAGPPPDPFGNQAVDLTPKSPPPPETAVVEAAPAPAPAPEPTVAPAAAVAPAGLEVRVHAYFCTDKSELTPASATALDKEIAAWGDRIAGKDLIVAGYADTRGVAVYNTWLGGERAKAVVNYLTAKGFKATALAVGELPDLTDNQNCANQRRVDIRLSDAPEETPSRSCTPPPELVALACMVEQRKPPTSSEQEPPAPAQ